ncbi:glucosaminidase domain-containing protein [Peptostreptococcus sp. D1]|uniref:glucosaminidase domain-containing protein n=1 Tax=Peptostreptococcus sp. D1 TaxID=72304 RepID=UPI0008EAFFA8|nr:glucosaminidase domain-containing protein [Peptostreptococcus sp. D1]SFE87412.1 Flagellum-specific peptidoglycan hydrolase FlgJ [Peptostreptococcus sp. D1]
MTEQELFIDKIKDGAIAGWHEGKILPSVTIAQACLESGWGKSELAKNACNLFGIKAKDDWKGEKYLVKTAEYDKNNKKFYIDAYFRKYRNWQESLIDHAKFFHNPTWRKENYKNVIGETDYKKACKALQSAGYATSQKYANQLIGLIEMYKLYQHDEIVKKGLSEMRIFLSVGHSILKNGLNTSASGFVNEYFYNKELAPLIKKYLEKAGHKVDVIICPEKKFNTKYEESTYKLPIANNGNYNLVVELHLNASNGSGNGSEVFFYKGDNTGKKIASGVVNKLSELGFKNRGVKNASLYMINDTKPTAILIESFFCDNKHDVDLAKNLGFEKMAKVIAEGIHGSKIEGGNVKTDNMVSNKNKCVMYYKDGNEITAKFIAQQLGIPCFKDNNKDLPNDQHDKWDILYIGDLGKDKIDTAKEACKKFLGWKI